jgi:Rrf2 family iron-sulfur cluster assembly transcriptional regulator
MRLSLQVQYAICGAFDLAYNGQGGPVQVRVISERQEVPNRYLEQIFRRLRQAGIVTSKRGPGGGYTLARAADAITLREIVEAVEGPLSETLRMQPGTHTRSYRPEFLWSGLADELGETLEHTTLASLCRHAEDAGIPRSDSDAPMYFI